MIATTKSLGDILADHNGGLEIRNNRPSNYLELVKTHLACIKEGRLNEVPAPICVQMQVSASCSTQCAMCQHWKQRTRELTLAEWKRVFNDTANFGVSTAIFSGGEPLMRKDLPELLGAAKGVGLSLGVLTNGTMTLKNGRDRERVIASLAECADWVSISVDGTASADLAIRNPLVVDRTRRLQEFVAGLKSRNDKIQIWATVTLQRQNVQMNFGEACKFIQEELGISEVNFKIATGSRDALQHEPPYLLTEADVFRLVSFLERDRLVNETGNQLAYLRESFAQKIFGLEDVAYGAPVRTFYRNTNLRCFTPLLFSLIDTNGEVYPCCHLYRDNHGTDPRTEYFRAEHSMGNVMHTDFCEIWNGERYVRERVALERIDPDNSRFSPCGECTRHCQHNLVLTQIYQNFKDELGELEKELSTTECNAGPVFF